MFANYLPFSVLPCDIRVWYEKVFYPFQVPALDIATVLFVLVFSSILRGYTIQSISAYRLAAIGSVAFVLVSYPAIGTLPAPSLYLNSELC